MLNLSSKPESVSVSIRIPKKLLGRIKAVAEGVIRKALQRGVICGVGS